MAKDLLVYGDATIKNIIDAINDNSQGGENGNVDCNSKCITSVEDESQIQLDKDGFYIISK